jgi:hypothetical protein
MRKFVSKGGQNNVNAPVSKRKISKNKNNLALYNSNSDLNPGSRSLSESALNHQEAFVKEAPSMMSLTGNGKKSAGSGYGYGSGTRRKRTFFSRAKGRNSVLPSTSSSSSTSSTASSAKTSSGGSGTHPYHIVRN